MQIDEKALVELIDRELDVHEAVLTDPISLRRLQAQRIARRILAYESAKPKEAEVPVTLMKRPVEFRVLAHGNWLHFEVEQMAQESAEMHGTGYEGLYVRDGSAPPPLKLGSRLTVAGVEAVVVPVEPSERMLNFFSGARFAHLSKGKQRAEMDAYRAMLSAAGDGNG